MCDAPARAFIKSIKSHSGYSSCEKCTVRGEYHTNKVIFPSVDCPLRTDESFDAMTDEEHHIGACPLRPLPVGCVTQFGLDYMHLACGMSWCDAETDHVLERSSWSPASKIG